MTELWRLSATEAVGLLRAGEITPTELIDAALARMDAVDGQINALPIRCADRAHARAKDAAFDAPLHGLPIAVKDYNDVGGVRTTYGSPIFADHVAARSDATVATLERGGANPVAKSNVPEWAGGHTVNPVLGTTRNPWDLSRSAGGSSGGSAAALASGQVWLATGNDLGGSLRTPAGFCGVVGLRPTPGTVPRGQRLMPFDTLWVEGPMARSVADVALMLQAGAGRHPDDPLSLSTEADSPFTNLLGRPPGQLRVAFSRDLGTIPMAREVGDIAETAARRIAAAGAQVTDDIPDFTGAFEAFQSLRAVLLGAMMGDLLASDRDRIAPDIVANVERGFAVTPDALFAAERTRARLVHAMTDFFADHDLLICPTSSVAAFPVDQPWVTEIDGQACQTYIDWFAITFVLTLTGCPVLSLPCGLTADGLPVGLQLVAPPRKEAQLLSCAHWMESLFGFAGQVPIDPRGSA